MFSKISDKLAYQFYKYSQIEYYEISDISFAIELLLTHFFSFFSILIFGIIINQTLVTLIFLLCFIVLRKYSDGYHASTFLECFLLTFLAYLSATILIPNLLFILEINLDTFFTVICIIFSSFLLARFKSKFYLICCIMSVINIYIFIIDKKASLVISCTIIITLISDKKFIINKLRISRDDK